MPFHLIFRTLTSYNNIIIRILVNNSERSYVLDRGVSFWLDGVCQVILYGDHYVSDHCNFGLWKNIS